MADGWELFSVPASGGSIAGHVAGDGEPVLLLHGGPGLSDYTEGLGDELAAGYRVYRYQQRGIRPSMLSGPFDVEAHVADAVAVLDGAVRNTAWVLGHSWGGYLALHLALVVPDRIRGLVVVDPLGAVGDGGLAEFEAAFGRRLPPETMKAVQELSRVDGDQDPSVPKPAKALGLLWPAYFPSVDHATPMPDILTSPACSRQTWASIRNHMNRGTLTTGLRSYAGPALFLVGAGSPVSTDQVRATAALIPGSTVAVLEGSGHFPWLDRPGVVLECLDRLVRSRTETAFLTP